MTKYDNVNAFQGEGCSKSVLLNLLNLDYKDAHEHAAPEGRSGSVMQPGGGDDDLKWAFKIHKPKFMSVHR